MNILFFSSLYPDRDNPHKGVFNIDRVEALKNLGHNVIVVVPVSYTPPSKYLFPSPKIIRIVKHIIKVVRLPAYDSLFGIVVVRVKRLSLPYKILWKNDSDILYFFNGKKINNIINQYKVDAIVTSGLNPCAAYARRFKQHHNIPVISILEGSDILLAPLKYRGVAHIVKLVNNFADKSVFVSKNFQAEVLRAYNIKTSTVINNGYRDDIFFYSKKSKITPKSIINIISVGHLEYIKGHDILLKSFTQLGNNFTLTLIGDGKLKNQYMEYTKELGIDDRVLFLGQISQEQIKQYLDKADLFCMPSRSESFGIAALECMATGIPVIGSNVGGLGGLIRNGFNGFTFKSESDEDLIKIITRAVKHSWKREDIANWAKENYSWQTWANEIITLCNKSGKSVT